MELHQRRGGFHEQCQNTDVKNDTEEPLITYFTVYILNRVIKIATKLGKTENANENRFQWR